MSALIDTNLLIYAVNENDGQYRKSRVFLTDCLKSRERYYLCWSNIYEFLRVTTHSKVFARPLSVKQATVFLEPFFAAANFEILREGEDHFVVLQTVLTSLRNPRGNLMHDCHIATVLKEQGIRKIYTRDTDFRLFDFLDVIDPLQNK